MAHHLPTRREVLQSGSVAVAVAVANMSLPDFVFPGEQENEEHVPFMNVEPVKPNRLDWSALHEWITPQDQVFNVEHYGVPEIDANHFRLEVTGLVDRPQSFTLEELQRLPKQNRLMTLECSGNGASPRFINAIYNSKWTGTPLAPILRQCGVQPGAKEIVFICLDQGKETLRKKTLAEESVEEVAVEVPFGRSMSVDDALSLNLLLAYERNGVPLETRNGAPLRLIVPGWYGIANVKWLTRVEVRGTRYMGRFMARDYVTVRGEKRGDEIVYAQTSVNRMNLKSIIARVTRRPTEDGMIPTKAYGAVWSDGTDVQKIEVQVDNGPWQASILDQEPRNKFCWTFFSCDLGTLSPGQHTVVSRAIDVNGRVQPSAKDDEIALKKTYWEAYQQWPREIELEA